MEERTIMRCYSRRAFSFFQTEDEIGVGDLLGHLVFWRFVVRDVVHEAPFLAVLYGFVLIVAQLKPPAIKRICR